MTPPEFTHLDPLGRARMVDVTPKEPTLRRAIARGKIFMTRETASMVARGGIGKGDVLSGRLLMYDALETSFRELKVKRDPECPYCSKDVFPGYVDYAHFCGV